jgi:hypothetical protein
MSTSRRTPASHRPPGLLGPLKRIAERQGWTVELRRNGHWAWYPPGGGKPVFSPSTPCGGRGDANGVARLRRAGLEVPR